MREIYRILDANFNRAREGLRVAEDCGRFALNDPAVTAMAKRMRSDLRDVMEELPMDEFITSRDTPGDLGTEITSPTEPSRANLTDVALAACKRVTEALRTIEEYSKIIAPGQVDKVERMRYNGYTLEQRLVQRIMVAKRFEQVRLYVLLTTSLCRGSMRDTARAAIAGGADAIQLREKGIGDGQFLALAAELRQMTDETGRLLIINDRPDIAAMVGADGVHLGQTDLPVAESRRLLRPGAIIGRSTHNIDQVKHAINEGADYIAIGPIFKTGTKDAGSAMTPKFIEEASQVTTLPLVPIGGIGPDNLEEVINAGGKRVAVCSSICGAQDPKAAAIAITSRLDLRLCGSPQHPR